LFNVKKHTTLLANIAFALAYSQYLHGVNMPLEETKILGEIYE